MRHFSGLTSRLLGNGLWALVLICFLTGEAQAGHGHRRRHGQKVKDRHCQRLLDYHGKPREKVTHLPRRLEDIEQLRIGTYNVLDLQLATTPGRREGKAKSLAAVEGIAEAILDSNLDIVVLQEVFNLETLEILNDEYLNGQYRVFLAPSPDPRGIHVAYLVRKSLPLEMELEPHTGERLRMRGYGPRPLFNRGLPVMLFRARGYSRPLFALIGVHLKSKRSVNSADPESRRLRGAEVDGAIEIIKGLQKEHGEDFPVMIAGDFNGAVNEEAEFANFQKALSLADAFDRAPKKRTDDQRVTHTYHGRGASTENRQLDALLLTPSLQDAVLDAYVYRYKDKEGREKPIPRSMKERRGNPSDHFPVVITLDFKAILDLGEEESAPRAAEGGR